MKTWVLLILILTGRNPLPGPFLEPMRWGQRVTIDHPVVIPGFQSQEACTRAAHMLIRNEYLKLSAHVGPYQCVPTWSEPEPLR